MVFESDDKKRFGRTRRFILWLAVLPSLMFLVQMLTFGHEAWRAYSLRNEWLEHLGNASQLYQYYLSVLEAGMWQSVTLAGFSMAALAAIFLFVWGMMRLAAKRVKRSELHMTDETLEVRHGIQTIRIPWEQVSGVKSRWLPVLGRRTIVELSPEAGAWRNRHIIPDIYDINVDKMTDLISTNSVR